MYQLYFWEITSVFMSSWTQQYTSTGTFRALYCCSQDQNFVSGLAFGGWSPSLPLSMWVGLGFIWPWWVPMVFVWNIVTLCMRILYCLHHPVSMSILSISYTYILLSLLLLWFSFILPPSPQLSQSELIHTVEFIKTFNLGLHPAIYNMTTEF